METLYDDDDVSAELRLITRAQAVRVRSVGRIAQRGDLDHPTFVVIDPHGKEVTWLSAVFQFMGRHSYSAETFRTYAESFLRFARCAWSLGIEMAELKPFEYDVLRTVIVDPRRNATGRDYAARTLLTSEAALSTIYEVARQRHLGPATNPVRAAVDGPETPPNRSEQVWLHRRARRKSRIAVRPFAVGPVLTPEERATLKGAPHPLDKALVQVLDEAGPRASEVLSIRLSSLLPETHMIIVRGKSAGGIGSRPIPASHTTFEVIHEYVRYLDGCGVYVGPDDPIFRRESNLERPLTRRGIDYRLAAIVPGATPQKIRRTTATRLLDAFDGPGHARLIAVRDVLGHSSVTTTEQYLNYTKEQLAADFLRALQSDTRPVAPDTNGLYGADVRAIIDDLKRDLDAS